MSKTIIAFLTKIPNKPLIEIAKKLTDYYDVYIFIDDNNYEEHKNDDSKIKYIQIDNDLCISNGFQYTLEIFLANAQNNINTDKRISSYDKFFYYFMMLNENYDYIWIIEDDVFIPDYKNIINLNDKSENYDLVCAANKKGTYKEAINNEWFWVYAITIFGVPAFCSMVCCCRLSKKLMIKMKEKIMDLKFIPFLEFFYNSVAYKHNLKVLCPEELSTIIYRKDWTIDDFRKNKNYLFHPLKDFEKHEYYRNLL